MKIKLALGVPPAAQENCTIILFKRMHQVSIATGFPLFITHGPDPCYVNYAKQNYLMQQTNSCFPIIDNIKHAMQEI